MTSAPFNLSDDDLTEVTNYLLLMNSSGSSDDFDFSDVVFFDEDLNNIKKIKIISHILYFLKNAW